MKYLKEIYYLIFEDKKKIPFLFLSFFILSFIDLLSFSLLFPYLELLVRPENFLEYKYITLINNYFDITDKNFLIYLTIFLIIIFFLKAIVNFYVNLYIIKFSQKRELSIRLKLIKTLLHLDYKIFKIKNCSEYVYKIINLVSIYSNTVLLNILKISCDIIVAVVISGVLIYTTGIAFGFFLLIIFVYVVIFYLFFNQKLKINGKKLNYNQEKLIQTLNEVLIGFKDLKFLSKNYFFFDRLSNLAKKIKFNKIFQQILPMSPKFFAEFIFVLFFLSLVIYFLINDDNILNLLPILGLFGLAAIRLMPSVNNISYGLAKLNDSRNAVKLLFDELNAKFDVKDEIIQACENFTSLSIKNGKFYYDYNNLILDDINLEINRGEIIGIFGKSGSGKSTVIDIILGLNVLSEGSYNFNKNSFYDTVKINQQSFFYAPQETFLIDDSIFTNICFKEFEYANKEDIDSVKKLIDEVNLSDFLNDKKKEGLRYQVGENGKNISGGQKQKIIFARALYLRKKILIFDEPTSALDQIAQQETLKLFQKLKKNTTIILISHNLEFSNICDKIYEIENKKLLKK